MSARGQRPDDINEETGQNTSTRVMVGGNLTARQAAILSHAEHHRYVTGREVVERGNTHILLRGKRGGVTVLITELCDAGKDEAEVVLDLHRRYPTTTLRVLVPDSSRYLFDVEYVADHYNRRLMGRIGSPSLAIAGASFHPLRISGSESDRLWEIDNGTWDEERAARETARRRDEERAEFVAEGGDELVQFRALWARVLGYETRVTLYNGGEADVMYEWALERSARDNEAFLHGAFKSGFRTECDLRSWLWDAVENELYDLAEEFIALHEKNESDAA